MVYLVKVFALAEINRNKSNVFASFVNLVHDVVAIDQELCSFWIKGIGWVLWLALVRWKWARRSLSHQTLGQSKDAWKEVNYIGNYYIVIHYNIDEM